MADLILAQPTLYDPGNGTPVLKGRRCNSCGYVFFPPQNYGCEKCGAAGDNLAPMALAGRGTLHSFAIVHRHRDERVPVPFTVGVIILDDGPALTSVLTAAAAEEPKIGERMSAVLAPLRKDVTGRQMVELRFERGTR
ncbi:MAG: Zn-ribbon domain-containing OB-fold protein [Candidatus Binataceae bacterium]